MSRFIFSSGSFFFYSRFFWISKRVIEIFISVIGNSLHSSEKFLFFIRHVIGKFVFRFRLTFIFASLSTFLKMKSCGNLAMWYDPCLWHILRYDCSQSFWCTAAFTKSIWFADWKIVKGEKNSIEMITRWTKAAHALLNLDKTKLNSI